MINGSLPKQCSMLMIGSPGIGVVEYITHMLKGYIERGETIIFVTVDTVPEDIVSTMRAMDIDTDEVMGKRLFIIDLHSSLLGSFNGHDSSSVDGVRKVNDLEGIMYNIGSITKDTGVPVRVFVHSISTLFLYNQTNVVLKFFQISSSKIKMDYGSVIFTLHDNVHDERTVNHLMAISDGVIELKFDNHLNRQVRVRHMRGYTLSTDWIPFDIVRLSAEDRNLIELL
jgi:KaiC/GvpD/RAD55 family RecA-like ATPase